MDTIAGLGGGYCRVLITFLQEHIVTYGVRIRLSSVISPMQRARGKLAGRKGST